jgi:CDP-diacylglycerol--serine O-phosphatidyltransferase
MEQRHELETPATAAPGSPATSQLSQPQLTIFTLMKDPANICTLTGLLSALLGIYFAILGVFPAAIIALLWALFFDWFDGVVARYTPGRTEEFRIVGAQLDSLVDIISFGVCPAIILLSYGEFRLWFLPGAFALIAACALRLGYFNVYGMVSKSTYLGLASDNNAIIVAIIFLLEGIVSRGAFSVILYVTVVLLAIANVAPIRTPKFVGRWYVVMTLFVVVLTVFYSWRLLVPAP